MEFVILPAGAWFPFSLLETAFLPLPLPLWSHTHSRKPIHSFLEHSLAPFIKPLVNRGQALRQTSLS